VLSFFLRCLLHHPWAYIVAGVMRSHSGEHERYAPQSRFC
jgi:hypothetical protein